MKKFALILSGSGVFDGAEIHESTLTMLAIALQGGTYDIFAPDIEQHHVINHLNGEEMPEKRNVLIEAARIARGKIEPLDRLDMERYDALIMPGGFGVAKNLSDFAFKGGDCTVIPEVEKAIKDTVKLGKPLGALCISPAVVARVLEGVEVTVGQDPATIEGIEAMGGRHKKTNHGEVIYDEKYRVYTTPCYMLDATIDEVWSGAKNIVAAITEALS